MKIEVRGFEESIAKQLKEKMQNAMDIGIEEFVFWSKLMSIKADVAVDGDKIVITKEG